MERVSSWEASSHLSRQIPRLLCNPKIHHRVHNDLPIPRPCVTRNKLISFYGEELLVPRPAPELEEAG
jgi:hypothetical protein